MVLTLLVAIIPSTAMVACKPTDCTANAMSLLKEQPSLERLSKKSVEGHVGNRKQKSGTGKSMATTGRERDASEASKRKGSITGVEEERVAWRVNDSVDAVGVTPGGLAGNCKETPILLSW
jgi:hypothetical protein